MIEYWTMYSYGSPWSTICSKHRTMAAAVRAARRCESNGGAKHKILFVKDVTPPARR